MIGDATTLGSFALGTILRLAPAAVNRAAECRAEAESDTDCDDT